jgi:hypothetical protein
MHDIINKQFHYINIVLQAKPKLKMNNLVTIHSDECNNEQNHCIMGKS